MVDLAKLRRVAAVAGGTDRGALISEAADEIESLRAEVARLRPAGLCTCRRPGRLGECPVHKEATF